MRKADAIVATLEARGATIRVLGDRLGIEPRRVLDDDLRAAIRANRAELLKLLERELAPVASSPGRTPTPRVREARPTASGTVRVFTSGRGAELCDPDRGLPPDLMRCRGCAEPMPAVPGLFCFACDLGLERGDDDPAAVRVALELRRKHGPAGGRGLRLEAIRTGRTRSGPRSTFAPWRPQARTR